MSLEKLGDEFWAEMEKDPVNYYVAGKKAGAFLSQAVQDIVSVFVPVAKGAQIVGKLAGSPRLLTSLKKAPSGKFHREPKGPDATPTRNPDAQTPDGQPVVKPDRSPECSTGGACFVAGTPIATEAGPVAIEKLKVGDRVLTGTGESRTEIVQDQWRKVSVAMPNPEHPADTLWVDMLRSTQWVSTASCRVGGQVWIELEEIGYKGWAKVRAIGPCPEIAEGKGRVVTATLNHYNSYVYELKLAGNAEPLRPTDRHPIFSETLQEWVPAAELKAGELVKTASGSVTVKSITRVPGTHRVYNMEVETDHRYFAGAAEVLSHNADEGPKCTLHLNLGGEGELPGAVNFNNMDGVLDPARLAGKPIISGDLLEPWPMMKESVGQISARRLPNFPDEGLKNLAEEAFRVLKPGGKIHIQSNAMSPARLAQFDEMLRQAGFKNVLNGKGTK